MKYHTKLTFSIYLKHALTYKWSLMLLVLGIIIGDAFSIAVPYWYKLFLDTLASGNATYDSLVSIVWVIFGLNLVHWFFIRLSSFCNSYFQTNVMRDLSNTCFAYLHKHSFAFFNNNFVGSLVKRINRFYRSFEGVADSLIWEFFPLVINVGLIIGVLTWRKPILGIVVFLWVILFCTLNYIATRYKLPHDMERSKMETKVTGFMADTVTNHANVKYFAAYMRERMGFATLTEELRKKRRFSWDLGSIFDTVQWFLMLVLEVILLVIALRLWAAGSLTVGDFILIHAYLARIFEKLWGFGRIIRKFYEALADAEEMTVILDTPHDVEDRKRAKPLVVTEGKVTFHDVSFRYNKTRTVIDHLALTIKPGERIALVGHSGAGKSTMVQLLLRVMDPTSGYITIDGQRIDHVTQDSLHEMVSLVPQDPILFHRSLMDNIRYGKPDATDEEVFAASKAAHCHEFISSLPDQYNTFVGERGVKLSGGERQRVAIARAILRSAPILILDEATSSLDSESEALILDALLTLMKGKTVIVVAHRLSTIMHVDRIIVVSGGAIIEQGSHEQLLSRKQGQYKNLWNLQAGGFIS